MLLFTLLAFGTLSLSAQQEVAAEQVACTPSSTCKPNPECTPSPTCPPIACCLSTTAEVSSQAPSCGLKGKESLSMAQQENPQTAPILTFNKIPKPKAIVLPLPSGNPFPIGKLFLPFHGRISYLTTTCLKVYSFPNAFKTSITMNSESIKSEIKRSYGAIAVGQTEGSCCNETACCEPTVIGSMASDYSHIDGYEPEADLALGCGIPTEIAQIQAGDTVLDLGSGAGNDVFIARRLVGPSGKVIGIDMTPEMIQRARANNEKLGYDNVEFHLDEIEQMGQISDSSVDVVISNCVMNLVPDKVKAYQEVFRVLKEGGHFSISDVVHVGTLPPSILQAADMYAGCVAGSSEKGGYLGIIKDAGFNNIQVKREREVHLPDTLLAEYLSESELQAYKESGAGIYSVTVFAQKLEGGTCC